MYFKQYFNLCNAFFLSKNKRYFKIRVTVWFYGIKSVLKLPWARVNCWGAFWDCENNCGTALLIFSVATNPISIKCQLALVFVNAELFPSLVVCWKVNFKNQEYRLYTALNSASGLKVKYNFHWPCCLF